MDSLGGGWGVAYEARGYKQCWADGRAGKTGKPTAQIEPWLVNFYYCNLQDTASALGDGRAFVILSACLHCKLNKDV